MSLSSVKLGADISFKNDVLIKNVYKAVKLK